ncbi:Rha family transcriptional regulator [Pseudomonas nitroreducens]|uniref:phage regulatory CII family protein n=1 Tax=Pseudomonas nitroreducens TaxID=46680 RepID=UPI0014754385|nr:phage regulatory CII family protein [Pseudomonas nitroreducens]NMZ77511.1 Rha family transcriptional regulator [Pseudomonas nitroreducens]
MEEFLKAIQDEVLDAGAKRLYEDFGFKTHSGCLQYVNPSDEHDLKVKNFVLILKHVEEESRRRILRALLGKFGYDLVSREEPRSDKPMNALVNMLAEVGDVTRELHDALADGRISQIEKAGLSRSISEISAAVAVLEQSVKVA